MDKIFKQIFFIIMNKTLRKRPQIMFTLRSSSASDIIIFYASATFKTVWIIYTTTFFSSWYNYQYLKYYANVCKKVSDSASAE